jgi:hypothetical protein
MISPLSGDKVINATAYYQKALSQMLLRSLCQGLQVLTKGLEVFDEVRIIPDAYGIAMSIGILCRHVGTYHQVTGLLHGYLSLLNLLSLHV